MSTKKKQKGSVAVREHGFKFIQARVDDVQEPTPYLKYRMVRLVASNARDAEDCRLLLDIIGLRAEEGVGPVPQ